jgi:formylglycine-generating enzyme required for sulfatase activity
MNRRVVGWFAILISLVAPIAAGSIAAAQKRLSERVSPAPEVNPKAVVWRTPAPPASPEAGDVWVNPKDGMEMVYVAPGEFILGTSDAQIDSWLKEHPGDKREWFKGQQPQCRVRLDGYWIGRTEVTNTQYLRFVRATGHRAPFRWKGGQIPSGLEDFPVVFVDFEDAHAYCEWAGGRLPTELEWEKAARGTDGRIFPWGNQWDGKRCRNFELIAGRAFARVGEWDTASRNWLQVHDPIREGPAAVGSYPAGASPYGCLDMAGNAWEPCADWYDEEAYGRYAKGDLRPPASGTSKVFRGGSWSNGYLRDFRCAPRIGIPPVIGSDDFGFRCARGLP